MKRANELEAAASKLNAHLPPVSTQAVQTRRGMPPRIRAEHRESVFLCLPDELFREIGKHLPLEQWIALRQLCKVLNEQVDRQPPFILLDPDVQTDTLFCQYLEDATPQYAYKLANLVSKISMSEVFRRNNFGKILEEIAKTKSWERMKIRNAKPFSVVARPLLDALNHAPCGIKRKLAYYGGNGLTSKDRALVEEVQQSSSLQLTTLATEDVADFLPFIARNAEFSYLDLDLKESATLTRETFKALQQMQGPIKRLVLRSIGSINTSEVLNAFWNKSLESLIMKSSDFGNVIDLLPWLTLPLKSLKLDASILDQATLANALGITETLKTLQIDHNSGGWYATQNFLFQENIKSLVPALRMNHTIEHLLLGTGTEREDSSFILDGLLDTVLNHATIKYLAWDSGDSVWPKFVAPKKSKKMDELFFVMGSKGMIDLANFLRHLSSLVRLRLDIKDCCACNWEFLPLLSRLGVEEFSLLIDHEGGLSEDDKRLPIAECFFPGLGQLSLNVPVEYDATRMGAALGNTTALTSLELLNVDCFEIGDELVEGLTKNKSVERIVLSLPPPSKVGSEIEQALKLAKIIESIFNHASISYASIDCNTWDDDRAYYVPREYCKLLQHLKPGLRLELACTTVISPDDASYKETQTVANIYKGIVERYARDDSTATGTSSPIH